MNSDQPPGHGWWKATDGVWYPPESHPDYVPPPARVVDPAAPQATHQGTQPLFKKPVVTDWCFLLGAGVALLAFVGLIMQAAVVVGFVHIGDILTAAISAVFWFAVLGLAPAYIRRQRAHS